MIEWNEETLRQAASWRAFKEGAALLKDGLVSEATATANGWRGTVRVGKRPLRVGVNVRSATDLEAHCPCPENQASGALCCHAVATGLAVLKSRENPATPEPAYQKPTGMQPAEPAAPAAMDVVLTPNWRTALGLGKLSATLEPASREADHPGVQRLLQWMTAQRLKPGGKHHLSLSSGNLDGFIEALIDHPGVFVGRERRPLQCIQGARLQIGICDRMGDEVRLQAAIAEPAWTVVGSRMIRSAKQGIELAGSSPLPESLAAFLKKIAAGHAVQLPLREILANLVIWQEWLEFPPTGWLAELHFVPAPCRFQLGLDGSLRELRATLNVLYPAAQPFPPAKGEVSSLPKIEGDQCLLRNLAAEAESLHTLRSAGFQPVGVGADRWMLQGEDAILRFLVHTVPGLDDSWEITQSAQLSHTTSKITIAKPNIDVLSSDDDWLCFDFNFQTNDGKIIPREEIQRLLRSGGHRAKLPGGRYLLIDEEVAEVVHPLLEELELRQEGGHFRAKKTAAYVIKEIKKYIRKQQIESDIGILEKFQIPPTVDADLRSYQVAGCAWLVDRLGGFGGALLADDMGLGKTIQTIAVVEHLFKNARKPETCVLVVATTSLLGNWRAEYARFAPSRRVRVLHGADRELGQAQVQPGEVLITSYGTLTRDLAWHLRREYLAVVADEASLMRNPDTDHARAMAKLHTSHRIALSGTPVENGVRDLWSIFRFIQPGWLGQRADFRERYESPLSQNPRPEAPLQRLRLKTSPFILRRTKEQVAPELPAKLEIDEFCDMSADQWSVYRELIAEGRKQVEALTDAKQTGAAKMRILTTLLRLRQTCCDLALLGNDRLSQLSHARRSAKIERLMELLQEAIDSNHRILIFSQFQKQLLKIEKCISDAGWSSLRLDGQTRNRQILVDQFQDPAGPPLFLISLKAGGYGLNLTAADTVIHFDPWWNPAAEAQATDRAHRIGQTRPVTVYRLLTRGTVEEKVVRMQSMKRGLARALEEDGTSEPPAGLLDDVEQLRRLFEV